MALDALLDVAEGAELERARKGPADPTGTNLKLALRRVRDIHGVGVDGERARALVPARRLAELARYGLAAKAPQLRRHPPARRIATLVATLAHLQSTSIDDCLELFDVIMTSELLAKAERETNKQRAREHPRLARASATLARVVGKLLELTSSEETVRVSDLWHEIETVASREERSTATRTCSACSRSFTGTSSAATSTRRDRRAGVTRARSCSRARRGRTPRGRCSGRSDCPRTQLS